LQSTYLDKEKKANLILKRDEKISATSQPSFKMLIKVQLLSFYLSISPQDFWMFSISSLGSTGS
jgi:hypothetical protein